MVFLVFNRAAHQPITFSCLLLSLTSNKNQDSFLLARHPLVQELFLLLSGYETDHKEFIGKEMTLSIYNFFCYEHLNWECLINQSDYMLKCLIRYVLRVNNQRKILKSKCSMHTNKKVNNTDYVLFVFFLLLFSVPNSVPAAIVGCSVKA